MVTLVSFDNFFSSFSNLFSLLPHKIRLKFLDKASAAASPIPEVSPVINTFFLFYFGPPSNVRKKEIL